MTMQTVSSAYVGETDWGSLVFIGNGHVIELDPPCEGNALWFVMPDIERSWAFRSMASALDYVGRCLAA